MEDRFGLYINLHLMGNNRLHGSDLHLVNARDGAQLEISRMGLGSGNAS